MPKSGKTAARGYGSAYRKARAALLQGNPPCHWCGKPATTADHEPPIHVVGHPHLSLVPACGPCNFGRRGGETRHSTPSRPW
jgi:hypothetical protein